MNEHERSPKGDWVRLKTWNWEFTKWSQRALKAGATVTVASGVALGVSIAKKNNLAIEASGVALGIAFSTTCLLAGKELIEAKVRRDNNLTRDPQTKV